MNTRKMVLFKRYGKFCVTSQENYNAQIMDVRKITDFSHFSSVGDIINYFLNYTDGIIELIIEC